MLKLVVCIIILVAVCCAQKHLTCSITDDVLNQQSPHNPHRNLQGSPGKRGPKGQVGSRGNPGQKGEPGIPDDRQINLLRDEIKCFHQEVEVLKNQSKENFRVIVELSNGLYLPPHVYIYRLTPGSQSWQKSRQYCQTWGGDLAVYGVKTLENRKKLIQNLSINNVYNWIGANDIVSEGNWMWLNGERANSSELIWNSGQPDIGGNEDCVGVRGDSDFGLAHDIGCSASFPGLCEKKV